MGHGARKLLDSSAELIWTVEAKNHFEAMNKYYEYMDWGEYKLAFEEDKNILFQ